MNQVLFFIAIGTLVFAAGVAGCAVLLLRYVAGTMSEGTAVANLLFAVAALVIGLYLILDLAILLPVGVMLITAAGISSARRTRDQRV